MNPEYIEPEVASRPFQARDVQSAREWLGERVSGYAGYVNDDGTALSLPAGWSSVKTGTGAYTVTHNLGTTDYAFVAMAGGATFGVCAEYAINANDFDLSIVSLAGFSQDTDFTFILMPTS